MSEYSKACCTLPPVYPVSQYTLKGRYIDIDDMKVYVTGNEESERAVIDVYDIFGLAPSTLQGADIIASLLNAVVFVPDFFKGEPMDSALFPPDTDEKKAKVQKFITEKARTPDLGTHLPKFAEMIKSKYKTVKSWGAVGLCWGGKVTALASYRSDLFAVTGQVHPGSLDASDAEKITIPHICLGSKDENAEVLAKYKEILASKGGVVDVYSNMHHGWMGARAKLDEPEFSKAYQQGYKQVCDFFDKHM
ncbi:dienelactone hydrolase [Dipodascopsis uninucleata]